MQTVIVRKTTSLVKQRKFNLGLGLKRVFNALNEYFNLESVSHMVFFYGFILIASMGSIVAIQALISALGAI